MTARTGGGLRWHLRAAPGLPRRAARAADLPRPAVGFGGVSRPVALALLTLLPALVEAVLVSVLGPSGAVALAAEVTALGPIAVFHDLRCFLVVRSLLTAACVHLAWPSGVPRPTWPALLRRSFGVTVLATVALYPLATMLFGMAVVSVSYFFLGALPPAVGVMVLTAHGSVAPWWRRGPSVAAVGWAIANFLSLTAFGALAVAAPKPLGVPVAAAGGLLNGWFWARLVRCTVLARRRVAFAPVVPIGLAGIAAALVLGVGATVSAGSAASTGPAGQPAPAATQPRARPALTTVAARGPLGSPASSADRGRTPVLVLSGFGDAWPGGAAGFPLGPRFDVRRFSYRGLGRAGQPLPFPATATERTVGQVEAMLAQQVEEFARQTHRRVDLVAESEGALAAKAYLARDPGAPVAALVMLSPLLDPARVYFPPAGAEGWGVAAGASARAVIDALDAVTSLALTADDPLVRSIDNAAAAVRRLASCPLPGVRQLVVLPLADALGSPYGHDPTLPTAVVPAFHGTLLGHRSVALLTARFLRGGGAADTAWPTFADQAAQAVGSAWQVPTLPLSVNPAWERGTASCPAPAGG
jgi:hypothetical protein